MANVFLIGMMGSGKTTYAQKWAQAIGAAWYDLDRLIEEAEGMSVAEIFSGKGECYFRQKEAEILRSFAAKQDFVLATGGGAPCFWDNMEWMNENGLTIWLDVSVSRLFGRLRLAREGRPLIQKLSDSELKDYISHKIIERAAYYAQAAYVLKDNEINTKNFKQIIQYDDQ